MTEEYLSPEYMVKTLVAYGGSLEDAAGDLDGQIAEYLNKKNIKVDNYGTIVFNANASNYTLIQQITFRLARKV